MSLKTCSFRLTADLKQIIQRIASTTNQSQSAVVASAVTMLANSEELKADLKQDKNSNLLAELKLQLQEKDQLINKLVGNQTELIRQNDQSQQLLASFSLVGEGKLLEKKKGTKVDRTSSEEGSTTQIFKKKGKSKKGRSKKKKGKKK
jgi:predicted transcriptional regulator